MGEGPSGGDSNEVSSNQSEQNATAINNAAKAVGGKSYGGDFALQNAVMANAGKNKGTAAAVGTKIDSVSGASQYSKGTKVSGTQTEFTKTIMEADDPQAALYDYSNKVRSGNAGKVTNDELNALEGQGLATYGMGLRGMEGFGGKNSMDDYGTPMTRSEYGRAVPELNNPTQNDTSPISGIKEAQRVNNPMMAGLVGGVASLTPVGTVAKLAQATGLAEQPGTPPTNMLGKMTGAMTLGMTNPANPELYDAGNYYQAQQRQANLDSYMQSVGASGENKFSGDLGSGDDYNTDVNDPLMNTEGASNFSAALGNAVSEVNGVGGTDSSSGGQPIMEQDFSSSENVPGLNLEMDYQNLADTSTPDGVRFFSSRGRGRDFGDDITEEDGGFNFGFGRRMGLGFGRR